MVRAPHTKAELGRPEDPTTLESLTRDPLPKQDTTQVDTQRARAKQKPWGQDIAGGDEEKLAVQWGKRRGTLGKKGWVRGLLPHMLTQLGLTFGGLQLVPSLLEPASRVDVRGVGINPEVMALGISIKVQTETVATDLAP